MKEIKSGGDPIAIEQRREYLSKHPYDYVRFTPTELKHIRSLKGYRLSELQAYTGCSLYSICRYLNCRPNYLSERSKIIIQNAIVQDEPIPEEYLTEGRQMVKTDFRKYRERNRLKQRTRYKSAIEAMYAINEHYQDLSNLNKTILLYLEDSKVRDAVDDLYENLSLIKYGETIDKLEKPIKSTKKRLTDNNVYLKKILQEIKRQILKDEQEIKEFREYDTQDRAKGTSYGIGAKAMIEKERR